jgi:hypothetical protein
MKYHLKAKERRRFFDDDSLADIVNLTQEEYDIFDKTEYGLYKHSGKANISGGYCTVIIHDMETDECSCESDCDCPDGCEEYLFVWTEFGTDGESWERDDDHKYARTNKKFIY